MQTMPERSKIAIVGAGLIGSGWALVFARAGYDVHVYEPSKDVRSKVLGWASESLKELFEIGLIEDIKIVLENITVVDSLKSALKGAVYVQESVFETVEAKTEVSLSIDALILSLIHI